MTKRKFPRPIDDLHFLLRHVHVCQLVTTGSWHSLLSVFKLGLSSTVVLLLRIMARGETNDRKKKNNGAAGEKVNEPAGTNKAYYYCIRKEFSIACDWKATIVGNHVITIITARLAITAAARAVIVTIAIRMW